MIMICSINLLNEQSSESILLIFSWNNLVLGIMEKVEIFSCLNIESSVFSLLSKSTVLTERGPLNSYGENVAAIKSEQLRQTP